MLALWEKIYILAEGVLNFKIAEKINYTFFISTENWNIYNICRQAGKIWFGGIQIPYDCFCCSSASGIIFKFEAILWKLCYTNLKLFWICITMIVYRYVLVKWISLRSIFSFWLSDQNKIIRLFGLFSFLCKYDTAIANKRKDKHYNYSKKKIILLTLLYLEVISPMNKYNFNNKRFTKTKSMWATKLLLMWNFTRKFSPTII